jgi:hypothetical protein
VTSASMRKGPFSLGRSLFGTLLGHCRRPALKSLRYFGPYIAASWDARRLARRLACRVMCTPHGCSAEHPNVSRRSAHPQFGVSAAKSQASDADASRERDGLFEIVSCEVRDARPHPEERARRRRSANFERACAAMLLSMRGEDARRILAKRKQMGACPLIRAKPTGGCRKRWPAPIHCFRIVIYNEWCNSNV